MPPIKDDDKPIDTLDIPEANVTVDLTEDSGDEGEQEEAGAEGQQARGEQGRDATGKWAKKKGERGQKNRDQVDFRKENSSLKEEIARMRGEFGGTLQSLRAELDRLNRQPAQQAQGQSQQSTDPHQAKLDEIATALETELELIGRDDKRGYKRYNDLRRQEQMLITEMTLARLESRRAPQQGQQQQQGGLTQAYQMRSQIIQAEHPWMGDQRYAPLIDKIRHVRNSLINVEGLPDTLDTDRQAISQVLARFGGAFGLRAPAAPAERTRRMYEGAPPRGRGQQPDSETEVEVPRELVAGSGLSLTALRGALKGQH